MMSTFERAAGVGIPVLLLLAFSIVRWRRQPTASAWAQLLGAIFAVVVILAHIAEAFELWPSMGWGQPHSVGHYTDLTSAILAAILLSTAVVLALSARRNVRSR